jgi:hypothetical protein
MTKYKIICYYPSETWAVLECVEFNGSADWMEVHRCTEKGEEGYKEIKKWLKENDK